MRLIVTGGGTGGHVYPALAVLEAFGNVEEHRGSESDPLEVLFVGTRGGLEEQITQEFNIPFAGIQAGALRGKSPVETLRNLAKMVLGIGQALKVIGESKPQVVLATGGYVCAPVAIAARLKRIPILVYLPDVKPGWAVRFLSVFASKIAVTSEASLRYLPKDKTVVTGYPVRGDIGKIDRKTAKASLSLEPAAKTLLVLGGSRGSHSINMAIGNTIEKLTEFCQVIHASGPQDEPMLTETRERIAGKQRYRLYSYLDKELLPLALASADLVISRSGASTMGEFPAAGLPSILIPYPFAGAHQELNADVLVANGAAIKLANSELERLSTQVEQLLGNDDQLIAMSKKAREIFRADAAQSIAKLAESLAEIANRE